MRIMTFNTQHCLNYREQKIDYALMAATIGSFDAEIVGLNEMRSVGDGEGFEHNQTEVLSQLTGMEHYCFAKAIDVPGGGPYGNGFLSRIPIEAYEVIPVPDPQVRMPGVHYESRCLLKIKLTNGMTVLVIHFGLNKSEQVNAAETVVANLSDEKCILMGDFNVTPDDEVLLPIRQKMKDTADKFTGPLLSYPSYNPEVKIDYIFVSPDIEVVSADIPNVVASDHRPHIAEIKIK